MPLFSEPRKRVPQHGQQLLETFFDHLDLGPGMRYQLRMFVDSIRTSRPQHNKAQASRMWKLFVCQERQAYINIQDHSPFQIRTADGMKDIGPSRYFFGISPYLYNLDHQENQRAHYILFMIIQNWIQELLRILNLRH